MSEPMIDHSNAASQTAARGMPFAPAFVLLASFAVVLIVIVFGTAGNASQRSIAAAHRPPLAAGERDYVRYCSACHGVDGQGVAYMGTALTDHELLADNDAALIVFLTEGRPLADPRVEFPHPYRGGYPRLSDEQISDIVRYLHTL